MASANKTIDYEAEAGFVDKGDVLVHIKPSAQGSGINIALKSSVEALFGDQILATVNDVIEKAELTDLTVEIIDKGALDYTIRARTETAIARAFKGEN